MAGTKKFKPEQVVAAIISENGVLSGAADRLGCDVRSVYNYRDEFNEVAQAIEDARENHDCELLDKAERNLSEAIDAREVWATKYVLSTKGRSRGYTDNIEAQHTGEVKQIQVFMDLRPDEADAMEQSNGRLESQ